MSTSRSSRGVDLVIFDCDGVLVDSEVIACRAVAETLQAAGHAISAEWVAERFVGVSNRDMYAALERALGALPPRFDADMNARAAALFARELKATAGIEAALRALATRICVASSSTPAQLARKLEWTGLQPWFAGAVFSAAEVARGKPAPDLFLYAAARLGVAPARALVIEDSLAGIAAGRAAGMTVFGFTGGSHCRAGHGERLAQAGAELVFGEMSELPGLIDRITASGRD
jgi:HAD superfamily hydrolase (TIGR01509 family)